MTSITSVSATRGLDCVGHQQFVMDRTNVIIHVVYIISWASQVLLRISSLQFCLSETDLATVVTCAEHSAFFGHDF